MTLKGFVSILCEQDSHSRKYICKNFKIILKIGFVSRYMSVNNLHKDCNYFTITVCSAGQYIVILLIS